MINLCERLFESHQREVECHSLAKKKGHVLKNLIISQKSCSIDCHNTTINESEVSASKIYLN